MFRRVYKILKGMFGSQPLLTPLGAFKNSLYRTKAARFNADARLRSTQTWANRALMLTSAYLVVLSAAGSYDVPILSNVSSFWQLSFSVILLGISAIESKSERIHQAQKFHENALKIHYIYARAGLLHESDNVGLKQLQDEYKECLMQCEFNHEAVDDQKSRRSDTNYGLFYRTGCFLTWLSLTIFSERFFYVCLVWTPVLLYLGELFSPELNKIF